MPYKEAHDIIHCYKYFRMRTPGHVIYVGVDICRVYSASWNVMNLISTILYCFVLFVKTDTQPVIHNLGSIYINCSNSDSETGAKLQEIEVTSAIWYIACHNRVSSQTVTDK